MSPARALSLWGQLGELDEAVTRAQARVAARGADRSEAPRRLQAARSAMAAYDEQVGAGELEADPAVEEQLARKVRELELDVRPVQVADGTVDSWPRADARVAGARRTLEVALAERADFLRRRAAGLFAELAPEARAAQAALEEAIPVLAAADRRDQEVRRRARRVMDAAGIPPTDLPASPVRGWADDLALDGVPLALPRSVQPEAIAG